MKLIQKTIAEGGFLTEQLYVPRAVWEQTHAQIYAIEKKLVFFNDLKNEMRTLGIHKKKGTVSKDFKVSISGLKFDKLTFQASGNSAPFRIENAKGNVIVD